MPTHEHFGIVPGGFALVYAKAPNLDDSLQKAIGYIHSRHLEVDDSEEIESSEFYETAIEDEHDLMKPGSDESILCRMSAAACPSLRPQTWCYTDLVLGASSISIDEGLTPDWSRWNSMLSVPYRVCFSQRR